MKTFIFCFFFIAGHRRTDDELEEMLENGAPGTFSFSVRFKFLVKFKVLTSLII